MTTKRIVGGSLTLICLLLCGSALAIADSVLTDGSEEVGTLTTMGPNDPYDTLACTGQNEPANFETFNLGERPMERQLRHALRRCDVTQPTDAMVANYVSYIYGDCLMPRGAAETFGCQPALEIQTWPSCQRSKADYTLDGQPYPSQRLEDKNGAVVYSFDEGQRIEVYSGSSTVVIFAREAGMARDALSEISRQRPDVPTSQLAVADHSSPGLAKPAVGAMEGAIPCN